MTGNKIKHADLTFELYAGGPLPDYFEYDEGDQDLVEFYNEATFFQEESLSRVVNVYFNDRLVGYYAYAPSEIKIRDLRKEDKCAKFAHPALKLGRLLVCKSMRNKGVGKAILEDVLATALRAEKTVPFRFLVVDAKPASIGFYIRYGFVDPQVRDKGSRSTYLLYIDLNKL